MANEMTKVTFLIEEETEKKARGIYEALGLDMESALKMFLRRTVAEGGNPLPQTSAKTIEIAKGKAACPEQTDPGKEKAGKVTEEMLECLWDSMPGEQGASSDKEAAEKAVAEAGMNPSTARIYASFLSNLYAGRENTRTVKISDLKWMLDRIRSERPESYASAVRSLEGSLDNWEKPRYGKYAEHVREYLEAHPPETPAAFEA